MYFWIIIPNEIVQGIEQKCLNNAGKFTLEKLLDELIKFANKDLQKYDPALFQHYFNSEIKYLGVETLKRALNKRPDNGVYINNNRKLLDLLCYYAYNQSWERTLIKLEFDVKKIEVRNSKNLNISHQVRMEINDLVKRKGDYALILIHKAIREIKDDISGINNITIDVSDISDKPNDIIEYKTNTLKSFSALTNALYYYLVENLKPYTYGYEWILKNSQTNEIYRSARMISGSPPGIRIPDLRSLEDLKITNGIHLIAVNLKTERDRND
jgi:hypothetical protein